MIRDRAWTRHPILTWLVRGTIAFGIVALVWSCGGVRTIKEEAATSALKLPFVRVLLLDTDARTPVGSDGSYAIECLADGRQEVLYGSTAMKLTNVRGRIELRDANDQIVRRHLDEVSFIPRGNRTRLILDRKRYRGLVRVVPKGERSLQFINLIYMEDYLKGVVPPEIGPRKPNEVEAVKAQAVAARTYAMAHLRQYPNEPYDMKASVIDQVYEGYDIENPLVNLAVNETAGQVLVYRDEFVDAYYHSTCGGSTDNIEDVWDATARPYLKAVPDADTSCGWSKYSRWTQRFPEATLRTRLQEYLSNQRGRDIVLDPIADLWIDERTAGGRIRELVVRTERDTYRFRQDQIRWAIRRDTTTALILPSARFDIDKQHHADGRLSSVTLRGSGYGHGIGMCQCGAIGKARSGWTYATILKHYYTDVDIKTLY